MINQTRKHHRIQLGVHIVDDDGEVFISFSFYLLQRRESKGCGNYLDLAGTEHVADRFSVSPKTEIVPVWTLARKPRPSVPRPRLIIPFLVVFFQFLGLLSRFKPSLATVLQFEIWKVLTTEIFIDRTKGLQENLTTALTTHDNHCGSLRESCFPDHHLTI